MKSVPARLGRGEPESQVQPSNHTWRC